MEHLLIGLAAVVVLGVLAQWLSWRLRLPSILLLLIVGFLAGPATGFLEPDVIFGELLFPIVSLSVAIILFEGGLSLDISELKGFGGLVRNLVTVGALVTWVLSAALAYLLLDLTPGIAILLGALLMVTGPTVILPLLRQVRPLGRVGSAVKWEGIVIDPIGAITAVLVFEVLVAGQVEEGASVAVVGVLKALGAGGALGGLGAVLTVMLLRRYWVPDFLQSPATLAIVVLVFAASNTIQTESGLLAVTIMGSALASQRTVPLAHIVEFKENLRVLLISTLFIILAARLQPGDPTYASVSSWLFVGGLILVVRPASVFAATIGSVLTWPERTFLAFLAPRGIVAAAVSSLFALEFAELGYPGAEQIAPLTFVVIVGTVTVYGLGATPLARYLGVALPSPQGILFIGADEWVRALASAMRDAQLKVCLLDSNWEHVTAARQSGLDAYYANVLSDSLLEELDLSEVGHLLAVTPNDEVNTLAGLHFREFFDRAHVFQLPTHTKAQAAQIPSDLQGRVLFGSEATFAELEARHRAGWVIKRTGLTEEFDYTTFQERYGEAAISLFVLRDNGTLVVRSAEETVPPRPGQLLISMVKEPANVPPTSD